MSQPTLAEESRFTLEFDEHRNMPKGNTIYEMTFGFQEDPMEILMRKQELERDELMLWLIEHTH